MSKTVTITRDSILSAAVTCDMLVELAVSHCGYTADVAKDLATKTLSRPSKLLQGLDCAKLRTIVAQKLELIAGFTDGVFSHCFVCLKDEADEDISKAGANTGGVRRGSKLAGAYYVAKKPTSASVLGGDAGKWEIWQHVWNCASFEEFFKAAPAKGVTSTNRPISASTEINWAVKSGWIVAGVKPEPAPAS